MKLQMFCTIDQTTAAISKPLSSIQTFHTHTHAIKFVSFHLPQMQFNMFLLSMPRLKPSLRNPNPHGHLRKELLLYLPFQKKNTHQKAGWLVEIQSLDRIPVQIQSITLSQLHGKKSFSHQWLRSCALHGFTSRW